MFFTSTTQQNTTKKLASGEVSDSPLMRSDQYGSFQDLYGSFQYGSFQDALRMHFILSPSSSMCNEARFKR